VDASEAEAYQPGMAPTEPLIPAAMALERSSTSRRSSLGSIHSLTEMTSSQFSSRSVAKGGFRAKLGLGGVARRTLGIALLMVTVLLWTVSNFLASVGSHPSPVDEPKGFGFDLLTLSQYIFSDDTFSKPFFVVYINTSIFAISLIPMLIRYTMKHGVSGTKAAAREAYLELRGTKRSKLQEQDGDALEDGERLLAGDDDADGARNAGDDTTQAENLSLRETAWLSLEFCMLWFAANYFASACLKYTSVGSVTIFTSLSSMFTLLACALMKVEGFTTRKLMGVLASLAGVALISTVDLSGQSDENRGNFPHKSQVQILIGDSMALFSAVIYGVYVTVMKSRVGNEDRVNMPLFFGLVGLFNVLLLWPGFIILHVTGVETVRLPYLPGGAVRPLTKTQFELPPTGNVWLIIIVRPPPGQADAAQGSRG